MLNVCTNRCKRVSCIANVRSTLAQCDRTLLTISPIMKFCNKLLSGELYNKYEQFCSSEEFRSTKYF